LLSRVGPKVPPAQPGTVPPSRDAGIPVDRVAEGSEVPEDAAALRAPSGDERRRRISLEGKRQVVLSPSWAITWRWSATA
jgi:hypothetical protein